MNQQGKGGRERRRKRNVRRKRMMSRDIIFVVAVTALPPCHLPPLCAYC